MSSNNASNKGIHSFNATLDTTAASTPEDNTRSGEASKSTTEPRQQKGFRKDVGDNHSEISTSSDSDVSEFEDEAYQAHRRSPGLLINTNIPAGTRLPNGDHTDETKAPREKAVSWSSLPRKDQLLVLALARLSEPLAQTSLGSYLFYQLQSFDPSLPDASIASQAGIISAAFPFSQFLTAILWGRFADSERGGRKRVIFIGLLGTMLSMIGFGFSQNFATAIAFRCLGGVLNGNIGVMRTMISEIIKEKKFQSRAFILLPMTFNIGVIVGPILGKSVKLTRSLVAYDFRWSSCESCSKLSIYFRPRLENWWQRWCAMDEEMAIRITESYVRHVLVLRLSFSFPLPRRN